MTSIKKMTNAELITDCEKRIKEYMETRCGGVLVVCGLEEIIKRLERQRVENENLLEICKNKDRIIRKVNRRRIDEIAINC